MGQITTRTFCEAMQSAASKSGWVRWPISDEVGKSTFDFLAASWKELTPQERSKWGTSVSTGDAELVEARIRELVVLALLRRLGHSPQYVPDSNGLTPDMRFTETGRSTLVMSLSPKAPSRPLGVTESGMAVGT